MDIDMMLLVRRMSNLFNSEIGQIKMYNKDMYDEKILINVGDEYSGFIGLRIGSFRIKEKIDTRPFFGNILDKQFAEACVGGNLNTIQLLIAKGANNNWDAGLIYASLGGHLDIVRFMVDNGAKLWNEALIYACSREHLEIVKFLIEKGATKCRYCHRSMQEHLR
jgi:hypothetical protein